MLLKDFKDSLAQDHPPAGVSIFLMALWYDAKGRWTQAHEFAQEVDHAQGSWVHAYLHRKEGDRSNAAYWYRRAGKEFPLAPLPQEWDELVSFFLTHQ